MQSTLRDQKLSPERWTFAVSDDETIRRLAVALDFKFQSVEGFFAHSNLIALLDANGKVVHREEALGADIQPIVQAARRLLTNP